MTEKDVPYSQEINQQSMPILSTPSSLLRQSIKNISMKYVSSQKSSPLKSINLAIQNKKCRLRELLKDEDSNKQEQILQKYCSLRQTSGQFVQLIEYYKYYTQTSIIYQPLFFRIMYLNRECKKQVEYNRLKNMLQLTCSENSKVQNQQMVEQSNAGSAGSLFILSKMSITKMFDQQSEVIAKLNSKLQKSFGPNCFRTLEELDKNYTFQKRRGDNVVDSNLFKKAAPTQKQNLATSNCKSKAHHKRNSCEQVSVKKLIIKQSSLHKKKQLSMDNLILAKECYTKPRLLQNTLKKTSKVRQKASAQMAQQTTKFDDIKARILQTKQKIQREKLQLKKKAPLTNNRAETNKVPKLAPLPSATEKQLVKKGLKFTFI